MFKAYPRHSIQFGSEFLYLCLQELFSPTNEANVEAFEKKFSEFLGTKYAAVVPSARFGLYAGLHFQRWEAGSEVIMPAYTFKGMALAVKAAGFQPIFVDCKYDDCNIDEKLIEIKINANTRAILVSHMFGIPCHLKELAEISKKHKLELIEDCAHACGAVYEGGKAGSFGQFSVFSFGVGKSIACVGGGAVATDDPDLYAFIKKENEQLPLPARWKFSKKAVAVFFISLLTRQPLFSIVTYPGLVFAGIFDINYIDRICNEDMDLGDVMEAISDAKRFTALQAVLGLRQLEGLEKKNAILLRNASMYDALLDFRLNPGLKKEQKKEIAVRHYYMIRAKKRDLSRRRLLLQGIDTKSEDMCDCSKIEGFNPTGEEFPNASQAIHELMEIPNNNSLGERDIQYIAERVNRI